MKKAKVLTAVLAAAVLSVQALSIVPGSISAAEKGQLTACAYTENQDGTWIREPPRGNWMYIHTDHTFTTNNWEKINNKWYYFDGSGWMQQGWLTYNGRRYYLDSNGAMHTGWKKLNGKWYFFDSNGAMHTGWKLYKGDWYYLDSNGVMVTGFLYIDGKLYYLNEDGVWTH